MIDLKPKDFEIIADIIKRYVPDRRVVAFGSRVKWTAKTGSDLDLCVIGKHPLSLQEIASLEEAFSESDLPMKIDVVDWATISEEFRKIIEKDAVEIQKPVEKWHSIKLSDACVKNGGIQTGPFGSQLHQSDYVETGTPIITVEHLGDNRITRQNLPLITDADRDRLKKYSLKAGDIVFSRVGSVDRRALVRKEEDGWLFSGRCLRVRLDETKANPAFVSFQFGLESFKEYIRSIAVGATMPSLNTQILSDVQIILPSLAEQKSIANILSAVDDKIELNRRMNETLEAMAKALFKSWFVDFDPVRAKTEGRQPEGLAPEIAALFPDGFVESKIGQIPIGWSIAKLGEEFNLTMGQSPPGETYNELQIGLPFYQGRTDFGFRYPSPRIYCSAPTRIAETGDTLISVRAPVGDINMAFEKCCLGRGVASVRHKTGAISYTYYSLINIQSSFNSFEAEGTVFGSINKKDFECLSLITPTKSLIDEFENIIMPIDLKIRLASEQITSLIQIRDTLLPKLMSGEIRVQEAEALVEAIA